MKKFLLFLIIFLLITSPCWGSGCDSDTRLLLHFNEADGTTGVGNILDEDCDENGAHTTTAVDNAQTDSSLTKFSNTLLIDGSGDYLHMPDSTDWDLFANTTTDWTIDFWGRIATDNTRVQWWAQFESNTPKDGYFFWIGSDGMMHFDAFTAGSSIYTISSSVNNTFDDNLFHHVALIINQEGSTNDFGIYVDGVNVTNSTDNSTDTYAAKMHLGALVPDDTGTPIVQAANSMDEFRIQKSNYFDKNPSDGTSLTVPTEEYSAISTRNRMKRLGFNVEGMPENVQYFSQMVRLKTGGYKKVESIHGYTYN